MLYYVISDTLKSDKKQYYTIIHNTTQYFIMDQAHMSLDQPRAQEFTKYIGHPSPDP